MNREISSIVSRLLEDHIPGGSTIGELHDVDAVDSEQLKIGIGVEMEHTDDPKVAEEIALDHLAEDPHYYAKLSKCGLAD